VHAVQHGHRMAVEEARRGNVGAQHALLDYLVRVVAMHRYDGVDLALLIENDARFHRFKVDGAAPVPGTAQGTVKGVQLPKTAVQFPGDLGVLTAAPSTSATCV
jgi:hypothetical protein